MSSVIRPSYNVKEVGTQKNAKIKDEAAWQLVSGLVIIITIMDSSFAQKTDLQAEYHTLFSRNS